MDDYEPFNDVTYTPKKHGPMSLYDFAQLFAPMLKYCVILFVFYKVAEHFNRVLEEEADLKEREHQRPKLSKDLIHSSDEEEDEESEDENDEEEQIHEELITDGSNLVSMSDHNRGMTERTKKDKNPLFDGLKQIEEELKQKQANGEDINVSWNKLHHTMLKRYKQKFPNHGPNMPVDDDYDDDFKELLKKHNIDPNELRKSQDA